MYVTHQFTYVFLESRDLGHVVGEEFPDYPGMITLPRAPWCVAHAAHATIERQGIALSVRKLKSDITIAHITRLPL